MIPTVINEYCSIHLVICYHYYNELCVKSVRHKSVCPASCGEEVIFREVRDNRLLQIGCFMPCIVSASVLCSFVLLFALVCVVKTIFLFVILCEL
jgi:hypothetical protein